MNDDMFPHAILEINNPENLILFKKVVIPSSFGDETKTPPVVGKYCNVLMVYEANGHAYLYSSDGIPTALGFSSGGILVVSEFPELDQAAQGFLYIKTDTGEAQITDDGENWTIIAGHYGAVYAVDAQPNAADAEPDSIYVNYTTGDAWLTHDNINWITINEPGGKVLLVENFPGVAEARLNTLYVSSTDQEARITGDNENWVTISGGGGTGVTDFDQLTNRPKYAGQVMTSSTDIPDFSSQISSLSSSLSDEVLAREQADTALQMSKQNRLVPGTNIQISANNVISATDTDTTYTAGDNIEISSTNEISAIIPNVYGFDTVADMKASTELKDGDYAITAGYYAKDDGGESKYQIRNKGGSDTPDDMILIAVGTALVAELVVDTEINSKQCGLLGDGTTDETDKLNTFFDVTQDYDRVLNKGVYLTSSPIFIKGRWRDVEPYTMNVKFDKASIKYTGPAGGNSVVVYNVKSGNIEGVNIETNSTRNSVVVIGCWYSNLKDWNVNDLVITNDISVLNGATISSPAVMACTFYKLRVKNGTVYINTAAGSYINSLYFNDSIFGGQGQDYCVQLNGANSHQNIVFNQSDISYATKALFDIADNQTGRASIICHDCYYDSSVPFFSNNNQNGVYFYNYGSMAPNNNYMMPIKYVDRVYTVNLAAYNADGTYLNTEGINYSFNGDLSSSNETAPSNRLMAPRNNSSTYGGDWTKTYETTNLNANGRCRKCILETTPPSGTPYLVVEGMEAPRIGKYTAYARLKVISGNYTSIQLTHKGLSSIFSATDIGSNEVLLIASKETPTFSEGEKLNFTINFIGAEVGFTCEVYEVGMVLGTMYNPYAKLHLGAII